MPVIKCSNGKYRIGSGACIFDTEEKAQSVWAAIRVSMVDSYNDYPEAAKANARRALNIKKEIKKRFKRVFDNNNNQTPSQPSSNKDN
jgi:hypothetical protein